MQIISFVKYYNPWQYLLRNSVILDHFHNVYKLCVRRFVFNELENYLTDFVNIVLHVCDFVQVLL
jgi:hypothetical protein